MDVEQLKSDLAKAEAENGVHASDIVKLQDEIKELKAKTPEAADTSALDAEIATLNEAADANATALVEANGKVEAAEASLATAEKALKDKVESFQSEVDAAAKEELKVLAADAGIVIPNADEPEASGSSIPANVTGSARILAACKIAGE